jgi:hypothetical protein
VEDEMKKMKGLSPVLTAACVLVLASCAVDLDAASSSPSSDRFDGPAELPRILVQSSLADTPAPGNVRLVKQGDKLQQAIDSAKCGDTLKLQAGAVFQGVFRFSDKSCDDSHWIVLRTDTPDENLPSEGTRITPCYAGVASLPARPSYRCANLRNVMARIEFGGKGGSGPIMFLAGANHYRLIGLEITRADSEASVTALVATQQGATAHHLIFDRVWLHGTTQNETRRGLALSAMTYVAVVDSFFSDFHCTAVSGACTDSQALSAGGGDVPEGPFKVVNNFLEAAGENVMFGGRPAKTTPTDIEIRRNHLFKPMAWKLGEPGFVGGLDGHPFVVKNHFELKNARRVLFEENLLENNWGGFSQGGYSILLTPKSQENGCPTCVVTDITVRSVKISNVGSAFQIANALSDAGGASSGGERYSIHDVLVDGVHGKDYQAFGLFAMIISAAPPLRDVRIEHVTASSVPRFIISFLGTNPQKMTNFTFANNILSSDQSNQIGSAGEGQRNCAFRPERLGPAGVFQSCFENSTFTHNMIVGGANWPAGNMMVKDLTAAGVRVTHEGEINRYRLCRQRDEGCPKPSPAIGAGTDGKDIGADLDAIEKTMEGII